MLDGIFQRHPDILVILCPIGNLRWRYHKFFAQYQIMRQNKDFVLSVIITDHSKKDQFRSKRRMHFECKRYIPDLQSGMIKIKLYSEVYS